MAGSDRGPMGAGEPYVPPGALDAAAYEHRRPPAHAPHSADDALHGEGRRLEGPGSTEERLSALKAELAGLEAQLRSARRPWFRDAAALVAVLALMFSFGTTVVSLNRTAQQDVHDRKVELLSLIDRLSQIPRDLAEAQTTFTNDPATLSTINAILTQQQLLAAEQAADVIAAIPDEVSASEYLLVGNTLVANSLDDPGLKLLQGAIDRATNANDSVGALRSKAIRDFQIEQVDDGRTLFRLALDVFKQFPNGSPAYVAYTHFQTQLGWAQAELFVHACDEARIHFEAARPLAAQFIATDSRVKQFQALEPFIAACQPAASASPSVEPSSLASLAPSGS